MRKLMLIATALVAGAAGLNETAAEQDQPQAAIGDMKVTGMVTEADKTANQITIGNETFVVPDQSGTALFPQVGAEVTVFYEEQDGKNVVTRIGRAQQERPARRAALGLADRRPAGPYRLLSAERR